MGNTSLSARESRHKLISIIKYLLLILVMALAFAYAIKGFADSSTIQFRECNEQNISSCFSECCWRACNEYSITGSKQSCKFEEVIHLLRSSGN